MEDVGEVFNKLVGVGMFKCRDRFLKLKFEVVEEVEIIKKIKLGLSDEGFVSLKWGRGWFLKIKFDFEVKFVDIKNGYVEVLI